MGSNTPYIHCFTLYRGTVLRSTLQSSGIWCRLLFYKHSDVSEGRLSPQRLSHGLALYINQLLAFPCLITYLLTYSMEQGPSWEANWFSDNQTNPRTLGKPKVCFRIYKCPPPTPQHPTSWRSIFILSSHLLLGIPSGLFPSGLPTKTLYTTFFSPIRATCTTHLSLLDSFTRKIFGERYKSLSS